MADDLDMDTEVRVCVTTDTHPTKQGFRRVYITALSTGHAIDKIILWQGSETNTDNSTPRKYWHKKDLTETTESVDGPPKDAAKPAGKLQDTKTGCHQVKVEYNAGIYTDHFPVLVDVYEEPDDKGEQDAHRHGWFDSNGRLQNSKKHEMAKAWVDYQKTVTGGQDDERLCWYGRWPAGKNKIDKKTGELSVPPSYEEDNKK